MGGWVRKEEDNLGRVKWTTLGKLRSDLANGENDRIILTRSTPVGKELTWPSQWSIRISTPIETWEHHLGKLWNQHLTSKQLEYHNSKQNKGLDCEISRKQTYDRDFIQNFSGGVHTGSIIQQWYVSNVSTFPNTFALVLDSNLHEWN